VTPEYAVRPTPVPDESGWARELELTISAYQAREFERKLARLVQPGERLFGFDLNRVVDNLSRVTERPYLQYSVFLYRDRDPNAAALADGRVYLSTGMLNYLADRGSNESEPFESASPRSGRMPSEVEAELAFVIAHELAHTAAQHLVKRYRQLQQQQMMMALVGLGTAIATREGGAPAQRIAGVANDVASLVNEVIISGYSQEQELESDQLGIRYVIRAGYHPQAALALLEDFKRFEVPGGFLRTHPYIERRRQDLERYLIELDAARQHPFASPSPTPIDEARKRLLDAQKLYPVGSQSWKNLQQQLDTLKRQQ